MAAIWADEIRIARVRAKLPDDATAARFAVRLAQWRLGRDGAPEIGMQAVLGRLFNRQPHGAALHDDREFCQLATRAAPLTPDARILYWAERIGWSSPNRDDQNLIGDWVEAHILRQNTGNASVMRADDMWLWLRGEPLGSGYE